MDQIRFIFWDLGGVLISVKKLPVALALSKYSKRFSEEEMLKFLVNPDREWWDIVNKYDCGLSADDEFFEEMSKFLQLNQDIGLKEFRLAWQSSLEFRPDMLGFVSSLYEKGVEQGIISNLNRMHQSIVFGESRLNRDWFKFMIFSYVEQCIKEYGKTEIFDRSIRMTGLKPGEILFIDDRLENLASAEATGMQVFHFNRRCHHSANLKNLIIFLQSKDYPGV